MLKGYTLIMEELRNREVVQSTNNPAGDLAERLAILALGLDKAPGSNKGFDAIERKTGKRIEIKGRRITPQNVSCQLGALRDLKKKPFDFLVAVVFNADFSVAYAGKIPWRVVLEHSTFVGHTRAYRFMMRRDVLLLAGVTDITRKVRNAAQ